MKTPLIFDIKRSSFEDGPGIRTTVFFKGCNLNCFWCHNPEGKRPEAETAFFAERCIGCGSCATSSDAECCPSGARRVYGRAYGEDELMQLLLADKPYYDATGGGVTFSGGECMLYPDFLASLASRCHAAGIHVAIDTAGNVPWSHFEKVLPFSDLILYDIKCLNPALHVTGTGCDNRLILQNLNRLMERKTPLLIRTPVIPGFNEGAETEKIKAFCLSRNLPHELLSYHSFGQSKLTALESARNH